MSNNFSRANFELNVALNVAGLLVLADLSAIGHRTALSGSASLLDALIMAPGIHRQQAVSELNGGELPIAGAMTTGHVFHIENQATVSFLQKVGKPGCLTNVRVGKVGEQRLPSWPFDGGIVSGASYLIAAILTPISFILLICDKDFVAIAILLVLMVAHMINVVVIRRRTRKGWKGVEEPDVEGDLLTMLSHDRWVRLRGAADDLKEVASSQWMRNQTTTEEVATSFATFLVNVCKIVVQFASPEGSIVILCLLLSSTFLLCLCNATTKRLRIFDCIVEQDGAPQKYRSRKDMAREMIAAASGRDDWAIEMGLIKPANGQAVNPPV